MLGWIIGLVVFVFVFNFIFRSGQQYGVEVAHQQRAQDEMIDMLDNVLSGFAKGTEGMTNEDRERVMRSRIMSLPLGEGTDEKREALIGRGTIRGYFGINGIYNDLEKPRT